MIFPVGILTQQWLDALAMLVSDGAVKRGEVIENKFEDLPGAGEAGESVGNIEAVKPQLDRMRRIRVVTAHPLDQLAIRIELAEAVPEAGILHRLVGCRAATGNVIVHQACPREAALD